MRHRQAHSLRTRAAIPKTGYVLDPVRRTYFAAVFSLTLKLAAASFNVRPSSTTLLASCSRL
jgi:hypothetical protein